MRYKEIIFLVVMLLFTLTCIIGNITSENGQNLFEDAAMTSNDYSLYIGLILVILCLYRIFSILFKKAWDYTVLPSQVLVLVRKVIIISAIYLIGITYLGFHVSSAIFLGYIVLLLQDKEDRSIKKAVLYVSTILLVCYFSFSWLHIFLPDTLLF